MKLISIICSSYNKPELAQRLIKSCYSFFNNNEIFDFYLINDNSNISYEYLIKEFGKFENFYYQKNSINFGKTKSELSVKDKINSLYVIFLDDKDIFVNDDENMKKNFLKNLKKLNDNPNRIFVTYYYKNKNKNEIIGKVIDDGESYHDTYFKKGNMGDHVFWWPIDIYKKFEIPKELKNVLVQEDISVYSNIFYEPEYSLFIEPIIIHDYSDGTYSKNILNNKVNKYILTNYCADLILKNKPCFKVKIAKIFEKYLIRKKIKIDFPNKIDKLLYCLMRFSLFSFPIIKKIYLNKIKVMYKNAK